MMSVLCRTDRPHRHPHSYSEYLPGARDYGVGTATTNDTAADNTYKEGTRGDGHTILKL